MTRGECIAEESEDLARAEARAEFLGTKRGRRIGELADMAHHYGPGVQAIVARLQQEIADYADENWREIRDERAEEAREASDPYRYRGLSRSDFI